MHQRISKFFDIVYSILQDLPEVEDVQSNTSGAKRMMHSCASIGERRKMNNSSLRGVGNTSLPAIVTQDANIKLQPMLHSASSICDAWLININSVKISLRKVSFFFN